MPNVVTDNPARSRYELASEGSVAFIDYQRVGKLCVLTHAEVPPALRGRGVAAELTAGALDLVRGRGETVETAASAIEEHMRSDHPELVGKVTRDDLVAMAEEA